MKVKGNMVIVGVSILLFELILVILKLMSVVSWAWFIILIPVWILLLAFIVPILVIIIKAIFVLWVARKARKNMSKDELEDLLKII